MMKPGPASTVEEHSLRNFLFTGDRGLILAPGFLFSVAILQKGLAEISIINGRETLKQPTESKQLLRQL